MNRIISYIRGVATELRKVQWPTAKTVVRYFVSVVLGIAFAAALVALLDVIFNRVLVFLIK